jgi:hypothetical protein
MAMGPLDKARARDCIQQAFQTATKRVSKLSKAPFSGAIGQYTTALNPTPFTVNHNRLAVLQWLANDVPAQLLSWRVNAEQLLARNQTHYSACFHLPKLDARLRCVQETHAQLQLELKNKWQTALTTERDLAKCAKNFADYEASYAQIEPYECRIFDPRSKLGLLLSHRPPMEKVLCSSVYRSEPYVSCDK